MFYNTGNPCAELTQMQSTCLTDFTKCGGGFTFSLWVGWGTYNNGIRYLFSSERLEIFTRSSDTKLVIALDDRFSKRWILEATPPALVDWNHIAVVFDPVSTDTLSLFIGGCQVGSTDLSVFTSSQVYLQTYSASLQDKVRFFKVVRHCI